MSDTAKNTSAVETATEATAEAAANGAPDDEPTAETSVSTPPAPGRPLDQILQDLSKPIPRRFLEEKKIQGQAITFCPWYRVQKILDYWTGSHWEYEIREKILTGKHILITVRVWIHAAEGRYFRDGTGIEKLSVESFGDPQSNAESMAFRRACAKWGLGLDLYDGDE